LVEYQQFGRQSAKEFRMQRRHLLGAACAGVAAASIGPARALAAGSAKTIKFGQSASLTGSQAAYGKDVQTGILAAFAAASAADASTGMRYELQTLDDGGVRSNTLRNALSLVDGGALALVGLTSGAGAEACLPVVEDSRIPLLGTASGNMGIRSSKVNGAFHVRAGYDAEYQRMVNYVKDIGMRRVAVVYLGDTSRANLDAMTAALATQSITPELSLPIDRNASSFDPVVAKLLAANVECVLFTANAAPVARIIDGLRKEHYAGLFYASSFAGQDLIDALAARQQSCVMSVVVPRPTSQKLSVVAQCQRDLALLGGGARIGITTLEGYIAGRVAVDAARLALRNGNLSRDRMKETLSGLRTDLGGYQVSFASGAQGSRYVDLLALDRYGRLVG
jgi:branched-chain amino acid transport system substrate-binding protein